MKSTIISLSVLSLASAQVAEWGRTNSRRARRNRSLQLDMSLSLSMSMDMGSMSMSSEPQDYYPPVEEPAGSNDGAIGMDAEGNPIALMSSAAGVAVSGAFLCVAGAMALF